MIIEDKYSAETLKRRRPQVRNIHDQNQRPNSDFELQHESCNLQHDAFSCLVSLIKTTTITNLYTICKRQSGSQTDFVEVPGSRRHQHLNNKNTETQATYYHVCGYRLNRDLEAKMTAIKIYCDSNY